MGFVDLGKLCTRVEVADVIEVFIETLPVARQDQLPFTDLRPGRNFFAGIYEAP